jgi:hypothetical protein
MNQGVRRIKGGENQQISLPYPRYYLQKGKSLKKWILNVFIPKE